MKTLYEIQAALLPLIKQLDETEDPLKYEMLMNEIDKVDIDRTAKLEGCCAYVKQLRGETETIAGEIVRLKKMMERAQKREQSFVDYMRMCMKDGETWRSGVHSIGWRKSEAVEITDESKIPVQYLREKLSYEADKAQAKQDIKMGAVIPGMQLVTRNNLQVR